MIGRSRCKPRPRRVFASRPSACRTGDLPGDRMRPSYLIIGVKRGGTTSLSEYLHQHPDVLAPYVPKGPRYFDVNHGRGWRWYETHFPTRCAAARQQRRRRVCLPIVGDSSPYIVFHPLALERVGPSCPTPSWSSRSRDPVVRAWSQYNYERKRGCEDLDPHAAFDAEPERLAGEEERIRADERYISNVHRHNAYLVRGHYADQIRHVQLAVPTRPAPRAVRRRPRGGPPRPRTTSSPTSSGWRGAADRPTRVQGQRYEPMAAEHGSHAWPTTTPSATRTCSGCSGAGVAGSLRWLVSNGVGSTRGSAGGGSSVVLCRWW